MKNLLLIAILFSSEINAQPNKNKIDSVALINNSLYQYINGVKTFRGSVITSSGSGISKDANGNFILGRNPIFTGNNYDNLIFGNNADMRGVSSVAALCTDCIFYSGANYSASGGDAHNIGGYSSTTFGYSNNNFIDGGTAIGTNIKLGLVSANNLHTRSVGIGSLMNIQNTDVYMFGIGTSVEWVQPGTFISYGSNKLGLLPDGRVLINGIPYKFPSVQGQGFLYNDGFGNISWQQQNIPLSKSTKFAAYTSTGQLLHLVKIN